MENDEKTNREYETNRAIYYEKLVNYWFDSRSQETKFYINISFGGIGVLITVLSILLNSNSIALFTPLVVFLYVSSLSLFLASGILGGITYKINSCYLEKCKEAFENAHQESPKPIIWLDYLIYYMFYSGLLFSIAFFLTFFFKKIM